MFPKSGPGSNCTKYTPSPLTPEEKELLLDIHNRLRSKVARGQGWVVNSTYDAQPKAADMRQLYWDDELELIAQRWADQCLPFYTTTPHDLCRDSPRFPVGQNIVTSAYSQPMPSDVEARTLDWYNEIKDFDPQWAGRFFQNPNPDPAKQTGHYTQLVWGWTHLLGCGRVIFEEEFEGIKWSIERIVCNYAPGGNFLNFPVYKIGEPCSKCPPGTQCSNKYTGLCARKSDVKKQKH
ncbi:venom allergen 3 isoform X2 [Anabrus simplex]